MKNEQILKMVKSCDLNEGKELIPGKAYLFKRTFLEVISENEEYEIIILVKNGIKVGGILRMDDFDIHVVMYKKYENQHILSDFFRTGIINELWPNITSVMLCGVYTREEYNKKKHLAELCHMSIKNEFEIEKFLAYIDEQRKRHSI